MSESANYYLSATGYTKRGFEIIVDGILSQVRMAGLGAGIKSAGFDEDRDMQLIVQEYALADMRRILGMHKKIRMYRLLS